MTAILELLQAEYLKRLARDGIPFDPSKTPDQQTTATLQAWAVTNSAEASIRTLAPGALEVK